jgi:hypothetical protein
MVHAIQFRWVVVAELDRPGRADRQRVIIRVGTRLHANIKPYVVESREGPVEVADLRFEDGSVARAVQFAAFRFLDGARSRKA